MTDSFFLLLFLNFSFLDLLSNKYPPGDSMQPFNSRRKRKNL